MIFYCSVEYSTSWKTWKILSSKSVIPLRIHSVAPTTWLSSRTFTNSMFHELENVLRKKMSLQSLCFCIFFWGKRFWIRLVWQPNCSNQPLKQSAWTLWRSVHRRQKRIHKDIHPQVPVSVSNSRVTNVNKVWTIMRSDYGNWKGKLLFYNVLEKLNHESKCNCACPNLKHDQFAKALM